MAGNRGVAYIGPGKVEIQEIPYPKLELQDGPGVNPANIGEKLKDQRTFVRELRPSKK